jgi:hypothetical protein
MNIFEYVQEVSTFIQSSNIGDIRKFFKERLNLSFSEINFIFNLLDEDKL